MIPSPFINACVPLVLSLSVDLTLSSLSLSPRLTRRQTRLICIHRHGQDWTLSHPHTDTACAHNHTHTHKPFLSTSQPSLPPLSDDSPVYRWTWYGADCSIILILNTATVIIITILLLLLFFSAAQPPPCPRRRARSPRSRSAARWARTVGSKAPGETEGTAGWSRRRRSEGAPSLPSPPPTERCSGTAAAPPRGPCSRRVRSKHPADPTRGSPGGEG